jgi:hypothetical protein
MTFSFNTWYVHSKIHKCVCVCVCVLSLYDILTPLSMVFWPPTHGILNPLSMEYRSPCPWYFEPPTLGFWPRYPWYFDPLPMVYWTLYPLYFDSSYPWYFDPPVHGILNHLIMVYRTPIDDISNHLPRVALVVLLLNDRNIIGYVH